MRDITLQNLSGVNVKITLWGNATSELSRNLDQHGIEPAPVIVVVTGCYMLSTDTPRQITLPTKRGASTPALLLFDNRKTISELLVAKWDADFNCTTKLVGEEGDWWCTKCEAKIDEPIPRCCHRLWYRKHPIFPNMSYEF
ncbi:hypothetical protein MKW92_025974 [Papaver armeniacum]|nr:hypothetical protein MKW92_025974 [Papaver armeniacum]